MLLNLKNISLTLFVSILFTLTATVEANDFAHRRAHDSLNKRFIKKRSPDGLGDLIPSAPVQNAVPDPDSTTTTTSAAATATASAQASASASASATDSASAAAAASDSASASATSVSASASSSTSASSSSTSASSSSTSTTTTTAAAETAAAQTTAAAQNTTPAKAANADQAASTVTHTSSVIAAAAATTSTAPTTLNASEQSKNTVTTVIIVVAASVGGLAILWTIFRKWKLGSSSKFNERMAPIDWQPTNDEGIVPAHRAPSRASSFHSSSNHDNGSSYHGHANLAPVGGYADLARGPSPQPQMQEALTRGPSIRSYNEGMTNGVPLHHQAGYGQAEAYDYNGDAIRF